MTIDIFTISLRAVNCYLLRGDKTILIDAGAPGLKNLFFEGLAKFRIKPEEIDLVIITHAHMDHTGIAQEIKELTGAKFAVHQQDKDWLTTGSSPIPPGTTLWGKILSSIGRLIPEISVPPIEADIILEDDDYPLNNYGIPGKIVYTPGHTLGSVSILLDSGEAFVGDLAMSSPFMRLKPGYSIFAENFGLLKESVKKLLSMDIETIYPAHGKPFSAHIFRKLLANQVHNRKNTK